MYLFLNELMNGIIQVILFSFIPFIIWLIKYRKKESFLSWIGFHKIDQKNLKKVFKYSVIVLVIAYIIGQIALMIRGNVSAADSAYKDMGVRAIPAAIIYSFIQTAMSEEILFRGFILKRLPSKLNFTTSNIIQGVIFGSLHLIMVWGKVNVLTGAVIFIYPILIAMMLGYLNEKVASGSIIPSWIVHGLLNTITQIIQIL